MSWSAAMDNLAESVVSTTAFGEPVTLPDTSTVSAVITVDNPEGWGYGQELVSRLDDQPQVFLHILPDAAGSFTKGTRVTARGTDYLVAETPEPDGFGMQRVPLMPATARDDTDTSADRWR